MKMIRSPRKLGALAPLLLLSACGSSSQTSQGKQADAAKARLLAAADTAAEGEGGHAKRVEAVETTWGNAADLTGHTDANQGEGVWVVQISGGHYVCQACPGPPGASAPTGDYLTMVLRATDFQTTDGGIGPSATNVAALGDVQVLRNIG